MITNEQVRDEYLPKAIKAGACLEDIDMIERLLEGDSSFEDDTEAPYWCHWYSLNVLYKRFPEAEYIIMRNPRIAAMYARQWMFRWKEAEPIIATVAPAAGLYAAKVLRRIDPAGVDEFLSRNEEIIVYFDRLKSVGWWT